MSLGFRGIREKPLEMGLLAKNFVKKFVSQLLFALEQIKNYWIQYTLLLYINE